MTLILTVYFFFLGLALASFLNALMYRLDKEYKYPDIFVKPSHCEKCKKELKWFDLIPVLSYIFTKGKCSKCGSKINIYYPISELFLGISLALLFYTTAPWFAYPILILLFSLSYFDYHYMAIPTIPTVSFAVLSVVYLIILSILSNQVILNAFFSGVILIGLILLLLLIMYGYKNIIEGFGTGDFIILLALSAFLSTKEFWLMFWVSIYSTLIVILIGFIAGKYSKKTPLPLLPFITFGFVVVVTYGDLILNFLNRTLAIF
jgi:leader peptidase (prepilin peptidase)/N-methyltransferase